MKNPSGSWSSSLTTSRRVLTSSFVPLMSQELLLSGCVSSYCYFHAIAWWSRLLGQPSHCSLCHSGLREDHSKARCSIDSSSWGSHPCHILRVTIIINHRLSWACMISFGYQIVLVGTGLYVVVLLKLECYPSTMSDHHSARNSGKLYWALLGVVDINSMRYVYNDAYIT